MAFAVASVMATAKAPAVQGKAPKTETLTSENASTTMADEDTGPADDVLPLSDGGTVFSENAQAGEDIVPEAGKTSVPRGRAPLHCIPHGDGRKRGIPLSGKSAEHATKFPGPPSSSAAQQPS